MMILVKLLWRYKMQNNNWFNQYQYRNGGAPGCFNCPFMQNQYQYGYYQPMYQDYYRTEKQFEDEFVDEEYTFEESDRNIKDIENFIKEVIDDIADDIKALENMGADKKVLKYLVNVIGMYLYKNNDKFMGPIERRIEAAVMELKKDLKWVFELLELFGVTPEEAVRFVEKAVSSFLRKIMPDEANMPSTPMWT